jgi:hypothetical protein
MTKVDRVAVVIVDDVCRFALYAWRYLSRTVGFGVGAVSDDGKKEENDKNVAYFQGQKGVSPLLSPGKDYEIWWVDARGNFLKDLGEVLSRTHQMDRHFLVDLRGPYNLPEGSDAASRMRGVDRVLEMLERRGVDIDRDSGPNQVRLVSSYQAAPHYYSPSLRGGEKFLRVYPKSPETLELLWKRHSSVPPCVYKNVLVTGAGFEFCEDSVLHLGTRGTADVLRDMFGYPRAKDPSNRDGYVVPQEYREGKSSWSDSDLAVRARDTARYGSLDAYWDDLLLAELGRIMKPGSGRRGKIKASDREYELRERFRKEFLNDDWGFLDQSLDALKMDGLVGWLTTNYTRFADRALALEAAHQKDRNKEKNTRSWKVVASSNEAQHLLRKLLQAPDESGGETDPYLFKLHGDISNLLTMALAGHDKEFFSPLSLPIDSLHAVYTAAEEFLAQRLRLSEEGVIWHIVGHGLKDRLLVQLIDKVSRATKLDRHRFIVVDKKARPDRELKKRIGSNGAIYPIRAGARNYMARLALLGPPVDLTSETIRDWSESMEDPEEEERRSL